MLKHAHWQFGVRAPTLVLDSISPTEQSEILRDVVIHNPACIFLA